MNRAEEDKLIMAALRSSSRLVADIPEPAPPEMPMSARVLMIRAWCGTPDGYEDPPMVNDPATMAAWERVYQAALRAALEAGR